MEMIRVDKISKKYRLGEIHSGTLSEDLVQWFSRRKARTDQLTSPDESGGKWCWPLKEVSFSVNKGEVFGIVGKNGAGKSTLLKILSKITTPSSGNIYLNGKLASLLEVGTGFHPDLSGRENIFLNGALLGMRKQEIKDRFDEIVDFSGVNGFLDTPVKRYSSGMFVRLAFAVAAHLESDILIVDEVLAVGDYEFQQKCMGKMQDVANNKGRTVLFVSHNSAAVQRLCTRAMLLSNGSVKLTGSPAEVLEVYQVNHADKTDGLRHILDDDKSAYFLRWVLISQAGAGAFTARSGERVAIRASLNVRRRLSGAVLHCMVRDLNGNSLVYVRSNDDSQVPLTLEIGTHEVEFGFSLPVRHGEYGVELAVSEPDSLIDHWESSTRLKVVDIEFRDHHALEGLLRVETTFRIV